MAAIPLLPQARIQTDKDAQFTDALIKDAAENEDLVGLNGNEGIIESVTIIATQQLAYEVSFYGTDTFRTADMDNERFLGSVKFAEGDGIQIAGAGSFRYDVHDLGISVRDFDETMELHVTLCNRSNAAKIAGAGGALSVAITFRPQRQEN